MIMSAAAETSATPQITKGSSLSPKDAMGKDQFLKLLIEQLKHQDPLSPMENTEFTTQMAQFSSLEQLYNVNNNLGQLYSASASAANSQAINMIGKEVKAVGNTMQAHDGQPVEMNFTLAQNADHVNITVVDSAGHTVASIDPGNLKEGDNSVTWDGHDASGNPVASGTYTYNVDASTLDGTIVENMTFMRGTVSSVTMQNGITYLNVGNQKLQLGDVMEVSQPASAPVAKWNKGIFGF